MKYSKRMIGLLLSVSIVSVMLSGLLSGCDGNGVPNNTPDITPNRTSGNVEKPSAAVRLSAQENARLKDVLQTDIDAILNSETKIIHSDTFIPGETYTGTAYYISADGNDDNNGLTPETAWQTIQKLAQEAGGWGREGILKPGDAVFFRRGDIFRDQNFHLGTVGLTFSAYGEGEKPIFTSSSENGSGTEKWELIYQDDAGKKIWKFYRNMSDVSRVVLNNGEALTTRIYEFYDGNGYISCEATGWWMHEAEGVTLLDDLLPLEESMTKDLTIISRPERIPGLDYIECSVGPLYLRCDSGNPGELYDSIEFTEYAEAANIYLCASDCVFDNISFRCNGKCSIQPDNWKENQNTVIQNCEFAYSGGSVIFYRHREDGATVVEAQGDGIYNVVRNALIQNNYFHDMTSTAVTYEGDNFEDKDAVDGQFHFLNNVAVNTMGIRLDSTADALKHLSSVVVRGNQVWNTGHMDNGKYVYSEGALVMMSPSCYGEFVIEDNVFYGTRKNHELNALLDLFTYAYKDGEYARFTKPRVQNNTYAQYSGSDVAVFTSPKQEKWGIDDPELLARMSERLDDATSIFYIIP